MPILPDLCVYKKNHMNLQKGTQSDKKLCHFQHTTSKFGKFPEVQRISVLFGNVKKYSLGNCSNYN